MTVLEFEPQGGGGGQLAPNAAIKTVAKEVVVQDRGKGGGVLSL